MHAFVVSPCALANAIRYASARMHVKQVPCTYEQARTRLQRLGVLAAHGSLQRGRGSPSRLLLAPPPLLARLLRLGAGLGSGLGLGLGLETRLGSDWG